MRDVYIWQNKKRKATDQDCTIRTARVQMFSSCSAAFGCSLPPQCARIQPLPNTILTLLTQTRFNGKLGYKSGCSCPRGHLLRVKLPSVLLFVSLPTYPLKKIKTIKQRRMAPNQMVFTMSHIVGIFIVCNDDNIRSYCTMLHLGAILLILRRCNSVSGSSPLLKKTFICGKTELFGVYNAIWSWSFKNSIHVLIIC